MSKRTFKQWIDGIFDHPVKDPEWFWDADADTCVEEDNQTNAAYLARLFTECDTVLHRFDDGQVGQGLNLIVSPSCSDHAYSIVASHASWPVRRRAIRAIYDVYAKCFEVRCSNTLGHLSETGNPINFICYMWWDVFPVRGHPDDPSRSEETDECLAVMERCLSLSNDACLEGAIHGLGHWQQTVTGRVEAIIDRFLQKRDDLRPELVQYAKRARNGTVL